MSDISVLDVPESRFCGYVARFFIAADSTVFGRGSFYLPVTTELRTMGNQVYP